MGLPAEEVYRRVETVMEQVGITYLKDRPTHALSFGQKKRVAFAGIMVMQPEVIILDEPTAGLDPVGISELMPPAPRCLPAAAHHHYFIYP